MVLVFDPNLAEQVYRNEGVYPIRYKSQIIPFSRHKVYSYTVHAHCTDCTAIGSFANFNLVIEYFTNEK